ncbi:hypothetical protein Tco_1106169 [Tanacetum coccineum]
MFRRCSAMDLGMPVMSAGFQANMSRLFLSRSQSSILSFSDKLPYMVMVCSGYSGWIAILIPASVVVALGGDSVGASATILHNVGTTVLLCNVTTSSCTGNLSISCAVDGTAWIFLRPGRPMIPLYEEGDQTIMRFIMALVECSSSPNDTISDICPNGQDISPLNPRSRVVARVICLLTFG